MAMLHIGVLALALAAVDCMNIFDNPIGEVNTATLPASFDRVADPIHTVASPIVINRGIPPPGWNGGFDVAALGQSPYNLNEGVILNEGIVGSPIGTPSRQRLRNRGGAASGRGAGASGRLRGRAVTAGFSSTSPIGDSIFGDIAAPVAQPRTLGSRRKNGGGLSASEGRRLGGNRDGRDRIQERLAELRKNRERSTRLNRDNGILSSLRASQAERPKRLGQGRAGKDRNEAQPRLLQRRRNDKDKSSAVDEQTDVYNFDHQKIQNNFQDIQQIPETATVLQQANSEDEVQQLARALGLRVDQVQQVLLTKPTVDVASIINKRSY